MVIVGRGGKLENLYSGEGTGGGDDDASGAVFLPKKRVSSWEGAAGGSGEAVNQGFSTFFP